MTKLGLYTPETAKRIAKNSYEFDRMIKNKKSYRARHHLNGSEADGYTGWFKVADVSVSGSTKVKVYAGYEDIDTSGFAGRCVVNDEPFTLNAIELPITSNITSIVLESVYTVNDKTIHQPEIKPRTDDLLIEQYKMIYLLATVIKDGDSLTVIQQHTGAVYGSIFGACENNV